MYVVCKHIYLVNNLLSIHFIIYLYLDQAILGLKQQYDTIIVFNTVILSFVSVLRIIYKIINTGT